MRDVYDSTLQLILTILLIELYSNIIILGVQAFEMI